MGSEKLNIFSRLIKLSSNILGKAAYPEFKSRPSGYEPNNYLIEWTSASYTPIEVFELLYRRHATPPDSWQRVEVTPHKQNSMTYAGKAGLKDLAEAAQYEARVRAKNEEGWNRLSEPFQFATFGAGTAIVEYI